MTRPFGAQDAWRLRRLQGGGTSLALEEDVLCGQSPLRQSASALLVPGKTGIETFLLERSDGVAGFTQARRHLDLTAAELIFIAPASEAHDGAVLVWPRLVADSCQLLGAEGIQRVYVALSEDDQVALNLFQRLGFKVYCGETVFRRSRGQGRPSSRTDGAPAGDQRPADFAEADDFGAGEVRPERAEDAFAIAQLRLAELPSATRLNEPDLAPARHPWGTYPLGGQSALPVGTGWVWVDDRGDLVAAWRVIPGRKGSWLRLFCRQDATLALAALDRVLDSRGASNGNGPLYARVRGHEPMLHLALRETGFEPIVRRFRLVKHLTRRVLEPAWQAVPALAEASPVATLVQHGGTKTSFSHERNMESPVP